MAVYSGAVAVFLFLMPAMVAAPSPQGQCMGEAAQCTEHLLNSNSVGIQNIAATFRSCGKYQETADCLDAISGDCKTQIKQMKDMAKNVLVDSGICDKKDEADKYSACWSNSKLVDPKLCMTKEGSPDDTCKYLLTTVNCYTERTKTECGEEQSRLVNLVMRTSSQSIAKSQGKDCPELASSSSVQSMGLTLLASLLIICVGIFC